MRAIDYKKLLLINGGVANIYCERQICSLVGDFITSFSSKGLNTALGEFSQRVVGPDMS